MTKNDEDDDEDEPRENCAETAEIQMDLLRCETGF